MAEIKIDKGVPIPPPLKLPGPGRKPIYPWLTMEIGESFLLPDHINRKGGYAAKANQAHAPRRFVSRTTPDGFRIWRVA